MYNIAYKSGVNIGLGILRDIHFLKCVLNPKSKIT